MTAVVFLDIDGVLNSHSPGLIDRECVEQLNRITLATGCKYVLSSSWRYLLTDTADFDGIMTLAGFEYMLRTHGAARFDLIGATPVLEDGDRGKEVRRWLAEHRAEFGVANYCVLDDIDCGLYGLHPFVQTDGRVGLTWEKADEVIGVLSAA